MENKTFTPYIPYCGAGIMFFSIVYGMESPALKPVQDHVDSILSVCVVAFVIFAGALLFLSSLFDKIRKQKYCICEVDAQCVDQGEGISI